jgi:hypothetical protein
MAASNGPCCQALETDMTKKSLLIGAVAATALLSGGWALAQSTGHRADGMSGGMHGRIGPGMHDHTASGRMGMEMHGRMGPGMRGETGPGVHGRLGPGGMGMMGMGQGSATPAEMGEIHSMLFNHNRIRRTVTNLSNGIRTVTESDDPEMAATIASHVAGMGERVRAGRDPDLPIQSPTLKTIFRNRDKINTTYENTPKGIVVVQTSDDPETVAALQKHAAEVSDLARRGMVAAHETMMKNAGGMMGRGRRGAMIGTPDRL